MIDRQRLLDELGSRLRAARTQAALSVSDLAREAGVSRRYVTEAEAGRANLSVVKLAELAHALGIPLADLCRIQVSKSIERVALIGLRGAGKSTIGPRLAQEFDAPFIELDRRVEEAAGMDLSEIFNVHGEAGFHRFESEALERVLSEGERVVLAAGGSIVTSPQSFRRLLSSCRTVWLRADPADHFQRVIDQGDLRPMRDRPRAMAELEALLAARENDYRRAEIEIETSGRDVDATVAEIVERLQTY
ncbi:MAG: helix-turn-helix domain-containing protein [Planctomycetes bacterium]|nr:helix-turn-helix domain-containing protein [Planctomycetota bacterium]